MHRLRLLAVLIPLLVATGCGFKPEPIGSLPSFPQGVTDGLGRRVTVQAQPRRVVSLDPGLTETAFAVGAGDTVVAASGREQYPAAAQRLPRAGAADGSPNMARLRRLHPDLVLAPNSTSAAAAARLSNRVGAPVYVAGNGTVPAIEHDVDQVGVMTGEAAAGRAQVQRMQADLRRLKRRCAGARPCPCSSTRASSTPSTRTAPRPAWWPSPAAANVAAAATVGSAFPVAQLRAAAPQAYLAVAGRGVTLAGLRRSRATRGLPAVRDRRFALVDGAALNDTGPRAVTEVLELARLLHPTLHIP